MSTYWQVSATVSKIITAHGNSPTLATVDFNSDVVSPEQLKDAVRKIGFDLIIDEDNSMEEQEEAEHSYYEQLQRKTVVAWIFALPVAFMGMFFMDFPGINWWMLVLSLPRGSPCISKVVW